jgi:hypothetical protein
MIEQAMAMVIAERPQLGPFASYLHSRMPVIWKRQRWDPQKIAALDDQEFADDVVDLKGELDVEADELERQLDNRALLVSLIGSGVDLVPVPYPEAARIVHILDDLDQSDIEPACKVFVERVNFHRMMRCQT